MQGLDTSSAVLALKAAAEPTRLRILALLSEGELNVSDLTRILSQSQPRISRHLKLLTEAGLIERFREGSWVFFQLSDRTDESRLGRQLVEALDQDDAVIVRDRRRAEALKGEREAAAQSYFREHAAEWDKIRSLYVAEAAVEAAIAEAFGTASLANFVDLGTGTGRMLELFAGHYARGIGIDVNQAMLAYARSRLLRAGLSHAQVRHGDIYNLPIEDHRADAVVMHQILHFLSDPARAISEAARILAPGGRLVIVDFAPHSLEELRTRFKHERLGFSSVQVEQWMREADLEPGVSIDLPQADAGTEQLTVSLWVATSPGPFHPSERSGAIGAASRNLASVRG